MRTVFITFLLLKLSVLAKERGRKGDLEFNAQLNTATPAWMNIDLIAIYLNAFPGLRNLSSEEAGLPEGMTFNDPMYDIITKNATVAPGATQTSLISSTSTVEGTSLISDTAISDYTEVSSQSSLAVSITTPLPTIFRTNNTTLDKDENNETMQCYSCVASTTSQNASSLCLPGVNRLQKCSENACVEAEVLSIDNNDVRNMTLHRRWQLLQCYTGTLKLPITNQAVNGIHYQPAENETSPIQSLNISCFDTSNEENSTWKYRRYVSGNHTFLVKMTCCNYSGCNSSPREMKWDDSMSLLRKVFGDSKHNITQTSDTGLIDAVIESPTMPTSVQEITESEVSSFMTVYHTTVDPGSTSSNMKTSSVSEFPTSDTTAEIEIFTPSLVILDNTNSTIATTVLPNMLTSSVDTKSMPMMEWYESGSGAFSGSDVSITAYPLNNTNRFDNLVTTVLALDQSTSSPSTTTEISTIQPASLASSTDIVEEQVTTLNPDPTVSTSGDFFQNVTSTPRIVYATMVQPHHETSSNSLFSNMTSNAVMSTNQSLNVVRTSIEESQIARVLLLITLTHDINNISYVAALERKMGRAFHKAKMVRKNKKLRTKFKAII